MAFGGVIGSTFAGVSGVAGVMVGGRASTTSVLVRIVGGVSGSASGTAMGSGAGGGTITTSAGMRSGRAVVMGNDPQSSEIQSKPVKWMIREVKNAGAREVWLTDASSVQA